MTYLADLRGTGLEDPKTHLSAREQRQAEEFFREMMEARTMDEFTKARCKPSNVARLVNTGWWRCREHELKSHLEKLKAAEATSP